MAILRGIVMAKVVLVTGCSSGLGRALAVELAGHKESDGSATFRVFGTARK